MFHRNIMWVENQPQLKWRSVGTLCPIKHNPHNVPNGTKIQNDRHSCYPHIARREQLFRVLTKMTLIHNSPFTIHHSPFTIHHSQFTIHHSPFTIHHSQFITHHSPFTIHHSPFITHHSSLTLHHSPPYFLPPNCTEVTIAFRLSVPL